MASMQQLSGVVLHVMLAVTTVSIIGKIMKTYFSDDLFSSNSSFMMTVAWSSVNHPYQENTQKVETMSPLPSPQFGLLGHVPTVD